MRNTYISESATYPAHMESTIRAVTPDSIPEDRHNGPLLTRPADRLSISTPASPRGAEAAIRHARFRAGSNNERGHVSTRDTPYTMARPRTRTLDSNTRSSSRDTSPNAPAVVYKSSRRRVASTNSRNEDEDIITSIGHPSISPPIFGQKSDPSKRIAKLTSPANLASSTTIPEASPRSRPSTANTKQTFQHSLDKETLYQLMKTTLGKMEGHLAFRRIETAPWAVSYCIINEDNGSLVYEPKPGAPVKTLVPDIRGCEIRKVWDAQAQTSFLDVCPPNSKLRVHLRPNTLEDLDTWFAALLCWVRIRPKGAQFLVNKHYPPVGKNAKATTTTAADDERRPTDAEPAVIKIGTMIYWDQNIPESQLPQSKGRHGRSSSSSKHHARLGIRRWQQVSVTLRENGELRFISDDKNMLLINTVRLAGLSRCAIQRLDPSVLDTDHCIAIYPQYNVDNSVQEFDTPIFVSLESRIVYEAWLVLLRAFTVPQLYGRDQALSTASTEHGVRGGSTTPPVDMFRMERSLCMKSIHTKLLQTLSPKLEYPPSSKKQDIGGYYIEVLLDGELRARTSVTPHETSPSWREDFTFQDVPAAVSVVSFVLKKRLPNHPASQKNSVEETRRIQEALNGAGAPSGSRDVALDQVYGQLDIFLNDLETGQEVDKWFPMVNQFGQQVGELSAKLLYEEIVILMAKDYQPLSELLHRFSNNLTPQIAHTLSNSDLGRLSDCLLNIFQVSGCAEDWLKDLVEDEIDGTWKINPPDEINFRARKLSSANDGDMRSQSPSFDREMYLRDMNKSAALQANLLFRGNTILTRALDMHMKRVGKAYLEYTLGDKLREIAERDIDCEVDPNKLHSMGDLDRNWKRLIAFTEQCWVCIRTSYLKCPPELRYIFRHIKACAEDRYGEYIRNVRYSSVSGFLFLRFFVPPILNPQLHIFGLLKDEPRPRARRAYTLIAKSLQGLANNIPFGAKESWMEPMNSLLHRERNNFRQFVDDICDVSSSTVPIVIPPPYSTPLAILNRLPPTSREGFPSLPHLIDHAKSFATLVTLWLDSVKPNFEVPEDQPYLKKFHEECISLRKRTEECLEGAERAERPSNQSDQIWHDLIDQHEAETANILGDESLTMTPTSTSQSYRTYFSHSRADSAGNTAIKQTHPPILGIRSGSVALTPESATSNSRHPWRGLGRQLSLEILPSSRLNFNRDQNLNPSGPLTSADIQNTISPNSNATSPFATSTFAGSDGSNEDLPPRNEQSRSGRTTPNQARMSEFRFHPWTFSRSRGTSQDREQNPTLTSRRTSENVYTLNSRVQSTPNEESNSGPELSDGGVKTFASANGFNTQWRFGPTGERILFRSKDRPGTANEIGPSGLSGSSNSYPSHTRHRQKGHEPSETTEIIGTTPTTATAMHFQRVPTPSRGPRRDWGGEQRQKRNERQASLVGGSNNATTIRGFSGGRSEALPRTYSDDIINGGAYHSGGENGEDGGDYGFDDDMTALPSLYGKSGASSSSIKAFSRSDNEKDREKEKEKEKERESSKGDKKLLLKDMLFKKKKPSNN